MIGNERVVQIVALTKKMGKSCLCETEVELLRSHFVKKKLHERGRRQQRQMRQKERDEGERKYR